MNLKKEEQKVVEIVGRTIEHELRALKVRELDFAETARLRIYHRQRRRWYEMMYRRLVTDHPQPRSRR